MKQGRKPANNPHPGKRASPWSLGPHCKTPNARESWRRLKETPKT